MTLSDLLRILSKIISKPDLEKKEKKERKNGGGGKGEEKKREKKVKLVCSTLNRIGFI